MTQRVRLEQIDHSLMEDVLALVRDKLRHYPDGEMGWSDTELEAFWELNGRFRGAAKADGMWWAR